MANNGPAIVQPLIRETKGRKKSDSCVIIIFSYSFASMLYMELLGLAGGEGVREEEKPDGRVEMLNMREE